MAAPRWTDSHCHLQEPHQAPAAVDDVLARAAGAGVARVVCIGTALDTSRAAVRLAERVSRGTEAGHPGMPLVYATIGLHPHDARDGLGPVEALLEEELDDDPEEGAHDGGRLVPLLRQPGAVVGVGECGLDYHYEHSPRLVQREVFAAQVRLAERHGLALVVHTREAWDDTLAILAGEGAPVATIVHCFTGGPAEAERCLELGAYLSFSGIVTFKNAEAVREAARLCPPDRLLVETDAPFLAPAPFRGRPNEPALVTVVGEAVAALRGEDPADLAATSAANAGRAFRLAPAPS